MLMEDITFRKATVADLSEVEKIYEGARAFMRRTGNPTQWAGGYPDRATILSDIEKGQLYLAVGDGIESVFAYIPGDDPTYSYIEGEWPDSLPYSAVHRVASAGKRRGMIKLIMDYCFETSDRIRIDTHEDNLVMQKALESYGFTRCGIIYLENGDPRIAYQKNRI